MLLRQAQQAGCFRIGRSPGAKRGRLQFLVTPESLRTAMMEQALERAAAQRMLELAQLAPGELQAMLSALYGRPIWQNDTPTLRIPYYRPLDPLQPGFLPRPRGTASTQGKFFRVNALRPR